jgi:hypothetical protein
MSVEPRDELLADHAGGAEHANRYLRCHAGQHDMKERIA